VRLSVSEPHDEGEVYRDEPDAPLASVGGLQAMELESGERKRSISPRD
jgi:hypothetical protein